MHISYWFQKPRSSAMDPLLFPINITSSRDDRKTFGTPVYLLLENPFTWINAQHIFGLWTCMLFTFIVYNILPSSLYMYTLLVDEHHISLEQIHGERKKLKQQQEKHIWRGKCFVPLITRDISGSLGVGWCSPSFRSISFLPCHCSPFKTCLSTCFL